MQVFTEHYPFPLKTNHYKGLKRKSLVNICRPKTITKASATTTMHLCSDATSITLVMSVKKKSQDLRLSSKIHASCRRTLQKKHLRLVMVVPNFKNAHSAHWFPSRTQDFNKYKNLFITFITSYK